MIIYRYLSSNRPKNWIIPIPNVTADCIMILRNRDWKKKRVGLVPWRGLRLSGSQVVYSRTPQLQWHHCFTPSIRVICCPTLRSDLVDIKNTIITIATIVSNSLSIFYIGDQTPVDIKHRNYNCNKLLRVDEESLNSLRRSDSAPFTQEDSPPSLLRRSSSSEDPIFIIYPAAVFGSVQTSCIKISIQLINNSLN